jgi:hypothetical protein
VSRQDDIYSASAAEIHYHLAKLNVCETGGVAATPREVKSNFRYQRKLFLAIEMLLNCIARTGLDLAGSTGVPAAASLGEFAVSTLDHLLNFFDFHDSHLPSI